MTILETRAIVALQSVRMPEKGWHGRRAEFLNGLMKLNPHAKLSEWQAADLWFLVWRYRRQVEDKDVVTHANEIVNGAMSLEFK